MWFLCVPIRLVGNRIVSMKKHALIIVCVGDGRGDGYDYGDNCAEGDGYGDGSRFGHGDGGFGCIDGDGEGIQDRATMKGNGYGCSDDGKRNGDGMGDQHEDYAS